MKRRRLATAPELATGKTCDNCGTDLRCPHCLAVYLGRIKTKKKAAGARRAVNIHTMKSKKRRKAKR